jgi:exopolysaccharide biosynthesis polyprenyl glycosylphosphotransferase
MIRRFGMQFRAVLMLVDAGLTACAAIALFGLLGGSWNSRAGQPAPEPLLALFLYLVLTVGILWWQGLYKLRFRWSFSSEAKAVLRAVVFIALGALSLMFIFKSPEPGRRFLVALFGVQFALIVTSRAALRWVFGAVRRRGMNMRNVLVVGTGSSARQFAARVERHHELGLRIVGMVGEAPEQGIAWLYLGPIENLAAIVHERVVDEVAICLSTEPADLIDGIVSLCESEGKTVRMLVRIPNLRIATSHMEDLDGLPVLSLVSRANANALLATKRAVDLAVATVGLVMLTPLFLGLALAVVLTDGRPVFFRQERVGLSGRRFSVVKFRTMVRDAETRLADLTAANEIRGHAFKLDHDPRVTRFGNWLRQSSLDELPQLWNVLVGDMSLVGPRPPLPNEVAGYDPWHRRRLSMKPGITGLWQVEARREPDFDRWVEKDLEYIDRWSPWLDVQILIRTIPTVLRASGR